MAVTTRAVSVASTATRLDALTEIGEEILVFNNGSATIYIGGADVTTANGVPVLPGSWSPSLPLPRGEALYGVVASGTHEARVIEVGL